MREIVLDTETTGLDPKDGHRIVEIGCVELLNHMPTGGELHLYVNPERDMPAEAFRVHGLSEDFLSNKPLFADIAQEFLDFVGEDPLVIHNAAFDMKFLNAELAAVGRPTLPKDRAIDTLRMAQTKFPGAQSNLDALCRRFGIDNSARTKHGALMDSLLLAEVYLELIGGRQPGLALSANDSPGFQVAKVDRPYRAPRPHAPSAEELAAHALFLEKVKDSLWTKLAPESQS
jgi:DNA polymerase-3 subunit epsilon